MLCCKQDWKQQQRKRAQARGGVWNFALQGVMIGLTFCQAAAYAICFVMVFDRMGNIQGVVCDIWLIWLAVLVLRMRCFRACFSTRDGGGAGGDAIWSRPVSFHSLPWFGSCHLGIAGDCYAAEDCYVWMPWPFVSELSASAVFGSPEMMAWSVSQNVCVVWVWGNTIHSLIWRPSVSWRFVTFGYGKKTLKTMGKRWKTNFRRMKILELVVSFTYQTIACVDINLLYCLHF